MFCTQCGKSQELADARFCPNCAFPLAALRALVDNGGNMPPADEVEPDGIRHSKNAVTFPAGTPMDEVERHMILCTLRKLNDNKTHTAEQLGISLKTLHNKLTQYRREGLM
jgi:DNA-binding NtrC family response regulator